MARSTDSPCFELESWTDLLAKAGNDLIDLKLNTHSHSLFNCVCTLNHMPDWISADPEAKHLAASGEELEECLDMDAATSGKPDKDKQHE